MKIVNRIQDKFSDKFLERMVRWVVEEVKLPKTWLKQVKFKYLPENSSTWYSGVSFNGDKRILISIPRYSEYPFTETRFWRFVLKYEDVCDILIMILAHEIRHQYQTKYLIRKDIERDATWIAWEILNKFKANKQKLLDEWREEVVVKPAIGSKAYYSQTLLELIDGHKASGGDMKITINELITKYKGLTILR